MGVDMKAIAQRRSELEGRVQALSSKKAVLESQIEMLCSSLGLDHVPSAAELDGMIERQAAEVESLSVKSAQLESAVEHWEASYGELNSKLTSSTL